LVWLREIERKIAKLSMTTFTYRSSFKLFYGLFAWPSTVNISIFCIATEHQRYLRNLRIYHATHVNIDENSILYIFKLKSSICVKFFIFIICLCQWKVRGISDFDLEINSTFSLELFSREKSNPQDTSVLSQNSVWFFTLQN
jgi:hypothetical protein